VTILLADQPDTVERAAGWRSAYVHFPFCARVCPYCDFAVVGGADDRVSEYVDALVAEISMEPEWHRLDAVFVGGGTPSRAALPSMNRILEALDGRFGLADDAEITLEANPEDWTEAHSDGLVEAGFNRVSFGVQSFDPGVLAALGRMHTPEQAEAAVGTARVSGFASVSVDLIYGHPDESDASWLETLETTVAVGPDHVSTYSLTVEPGTELWKEVRSGAPAPDADVQADRWEQATSTLGAAGYVRYEVSNHARPGHGCRYNLSVWGQGEYLAFGLGAHSYRDGVRSRRVRRLDSYIERVRSGIGPIQASDVIEGWDAELERLMLGLRRSAGVRAGEGGRALLATDRGARLIEAGVLAVVGDRLVAANPLLTDEIIRAVLGLEPGG
jgi:oxygen-independent coproporphyrinogen-3 oxidase